MFLENLARPATDIPHSASRIQNSVDLSIIIVHWNVWDLLRACLASLEQVSTPATEEIQVRKFGPAHDAATLEVIVVDNASADATVDLLPTLFPWVRLVRSASNVGFTQGNNRGYAQSRGRFVFFLNPDTELANTDAGRDSLWRLYAAIRNEPTVGMVGPRLRYGDGMVQNNRRRFPTRLTGFFESTWLGQGWPMNPWVKELHMLDWPDDMRHDVDWLVGAAMLARREALDEIASSTGPFDEGFFMYSEELDLCRRIKDAGWRIVFVPESVVVHYEGRSSDQVPAARHIYFNTSKIRYYRKYFGAQWAELLRRYLLLEFRWQTAMEWVKKALRHKRGLRTQRIALYREVVRSALRDPST